jgi:hypothetical protein
LLLPSGLPDLPARCPGDLPAIRSRASATAFEERGEVSEAT